MEAWLIDWLNLLGRWLHFVTGIAWIGSSFYFIWLDNHLQPPTNADDEARGVGGEVWSVHGGGFYRAEKFRVAPPALPATLHWFKWEAYTTWLSGMFLLVLVYWYGADVYLIDKSVADLSPMVAIGISAALIVGGWIVYDLLCRSPLGASEKVLAPVLFVLIGLLAWGLAQLFGGRAAYIHFGVVLGTIMVANVFFVIIPGQKQMVAAAERGEAPDPAPGLQAKQRSVHNTYFTLPVLFAMISNHFAMTYGNRYSWIILVAVALAGALIRVYFVARHKGKASPVPAVLALLILAAASLLTVPVSGVIVTAPAGNATLDDVRGVIITRCVSCHAAEPSHPGFPAAPGGVMLDTDAQIIAEAHRIHQQTVVTRVMPIGNLTGITEEERLMIDAWYRGWIVDD